MRVEKVLYATPYLMYNLLHIDYPTLIVVHSVPATWTEVSCFQKDFYLYGLLDPIEWGPLNKRNASTYNRERRASLVHFLSYQLSD